MGINIAPPASARLLGLPLSICGISLLLLLMGAAEVLAGSQPDLSVKLASETDAAFLGAGIFESSASSAQSKSQPAFPGAAASFRVQLKNYGAQPDSFLVQGTGSDNGFAVLFQDDKGKDWAGRLPGGFSTRELLGRDLAAGEALIFSLQVTPAPDQLGASFRVIVGASSVNQPAWSDQVKTETVSCASSAAVTVTAPSDDSGAPGGVVNYPYTVTNVGSAVNSFTLSVATPPGWPGAIYADDGAGGGIAGDAVRQAGETTPLTSTGPLPPGAAYRFFVQVAVPSGSADGTHADTTLSVSGAGASAAEKAIDQVTTSARAPAISVVESVRNLTQGGAFAASANALPGDTLEYRMAVTNSGSTTASSVGIASAVPANTACLPGTLWIGSSAAGQGSACAAELCGWVRESGGRVVAQLGEGTTADAGGKLAPGKTLYVYFRVQVQ